MKHLLPFRLGGLMAALALFALAAFMGTPETVSANVICQYANRVNFYAEPEKVTLVGYCRSYCNSPSVCTGTQTAYSTELWRVSCNFQCG